MLEGLACQQYLSLHFVGSVEVFHVEYVLKLLPIGKIFLTFDIEWEEADAKRIQNE